MELYRVNRNNEEFVERLDGERSDNNSKYLPCIETEVVGDDVDNTDNITYLNMTNYTKGNRTIPDPDKLYEIVENYKKLNSLYIYNNNIRYLIQDKLYRPNIQLLFDEGG